MTSGTVFKSVDARLLERYFDHIAPALFTPEQERRRLGVGVTRQHPGHERDGAPLRSGCRLRGRSAEGGSLPPRAESHRSPRDDL